MDQVSGGWLNDCLGIILGMGLLILSLWKQFQTTNKWLTRKRRKNYSNLTQQTDVQENSSYYTKWSPYCSKLHLSKRSGSWVVSINKMWIFNFNRAPLSRFCFFRKPVLEKGVLTVKICQYTKFHVPMLRGAIFSFTSEVWASAILDLLKLRD
jgi:L-lactate permease